MINVLVTGGNGQLASCIKDVKVRYKNLNIIYTGSKDLDIRDPHQVQTFFSKNAIDYCINCAAYTSVDKAEEEQEKTFDINAIGPKNLALACKENSVVLIHISTDFVFDGNKAEPYTEEDKPNPLSVYGASKLQGEIEIQNILKEHFIIRTSWLYSEYGHNFMKTMLRLAETRDEISVVSDQMGTPTYAGDLAEVILKIITSNNNFYGLYHYSNEGQCSWFDFAKAIFNKGNIGIVLKPIKTTQYPVLAVRPSFSVMDKSKIKALLKINISEWNESLLRTPF